MNPRNFSLFLLSLCLAFFCVPVPAQSFWGLNTTKPASTQFLVAEVVLRGDFPDVQEFSLFEKKQTYRGFLNQIKKIEADAQVKAVLFRMGGLRLGMAKALEMSQAITRLHKAGKRTYALLETASATDYIVALGCQKMAMVPGGMLYIPGIRAESLYFKKLLQKLGMEGDFVTIGDFKTAPEPFLRETMSDAQRKQLHRLIDDLYTFLVEHIANHRYHATATPARKLTQDEVKAAIDIGLLKASSVLSHHLVDAVLSREAFRQKILQEVPARPLQFTTRYGKQKKQAPTSIFSLFSMLMQPQKNKVDPQKPKIAVIYAQGPIYYGAPPSSWMASETEIWSDEMIKTLNQVSQLKNLRAVVLRVNSPGGDALASDLIWKRLEQLKKQVPLFVSMGNVAASGGYYIAMGADVLVAQPTTITGSIGVFGGKLVLQQTMEKIGISVQIVSRGKHAGIFSTFSKFSESERAVLQQMLLRVYETFTKKAAQGRKMTHAQLLAHAGGQVWTGRQAKQIRLVDTLGSLQDTLQIAMKRTGLTLDKTLFVTYPRPKGIFEALQSLSSAAPSPASPLGLALLRLQSVLAVTGLPQLYRLRLLFTPQRSVFLWSPLPQFTW